MIGNKYKENTKKQKHMTNLEFIRVETLLENKMNRNEREQRFRMLTMGIGLILIVCNNDESGGLLAITIIATMFTIFWSGIGLKVLWKEEKSIKEKKSLLDKLYLKKIDIEEAIKQLGLLPEPEKTDDTK